MLRINNIKIRKNISEEELYEYVIKKYKLNTNEILKWNIVKRSIDARDKNDVHYSYSMDFLLKNEEKYKHNKKFQIIKETVFPKINVIKPKWKHPVIIGAGPAGLFAALTLVQNGVKPVIIEQGAPANERKQKVDEFLKTGKLNTRTNVQFGEGGAGTFSDGKLTTGIHNPLCKKVLEEFVNFGAPKEILYLSKPHIGTDNLINIVQNIRNYIIKQGGTFLFNTKAIDFNIENNEIKSIITNNIEATELRCTQLILAIGHSSKDTFERLYEKGLNMEKKNFSVGVRIEHLQEEINKSQYGETTKIKLPPAEYKLAYHSNTGRSCYTFCMCPGGTVMASSSEKNTIVTNGMSNYKRDGINSNAALLVNVTPKDFKSPSPLAGIYFQKELEEKAFILGGSNYNAPIQRVEDFINNTPSTKIGTIKPTYMPGTTLTNLNEILPKFVSQTLKEALPYFDTKIKGFANPDSILTGVETRSSSPVKILRNEKLVSNINKIYPCGEGAGYAGGIMSAAVDGIKCAIKILEEDV